MEFFIANTAPPMKLFHTGALIEMPSWAAPPAGVKQEWQSQPIGIAIGSFWGASGPWETGGGNTIAVESAPLAAGDEIVIPLWATGEVTGVLTQPGATSQPTLIDSDGCVELTAAKILLPNVKTGDDVRRLPRWRVHEVGPVRWTMEGTGPTSPRVASYAPFLVVPPAPAPPTISAVVPDEGTTLGGETVTVAGDGFTGATDITFDGTSGTTLAVVDDTEATIVTPAHAAGAVDVHVIGPGGTSNPRTFVYATPTPGAPTITSATPTEGPTTGGTSVLLVGTDLAAVTGVTFGGTTVAPTVVLDTAVIATSPPGAEGVTTLTVTDGAATSNDLAWEFAEATGPVIDGPDVIANLVALLTSELGVPVSSRRSPTATKDSDPSVVVRRTGGPSKGVASDNPTVTIEAWAPTTTESFQLLQSARMVVIEAAEQGRAGLRRYDEFAGPADLPDPSTTNPRHTLTASVVTRLE